LGAYQLQRIHLESLNHHINKGKIKCHSTNTAMVLNDETLFESVA
jgi:hypothetical protein